MAEILTKNKKIIGKEVKLGDSIGSGGNGDVYLAQPLRKVGQFNYPKTFVVKVIRKEVCSPEYIETIHRELETIKKLSHPFIIEYIGSWVEAGKNIYSGCYCLATNYCSGGDLHSLICHYISKRTQPPEELVMKLMAQVFSALNYSHSRKIIHRDIKPGNVFLMKNVQDEVERAVLGDYGLARPLDKTCQVIQTRVGTPCYCSPEIVASEPYTYKTDMFSAGVMFYELMTLERPFWKKEYTDRQIFRAILNVDPIPRLELVCQGKYNSGLLRVISGCLMKHESGRPTAYEVLTAVSSHLSRYVRLNNIPVIAPMGTAARSPVRRISPVSPSQSPTKKKSDEVKPSPEKEKGPEVKEPKHEDPFVRTDDRTPDTAARLLGVLHREFASDLDYPLLSLLNHNIEVFALIKVLSITRKENLETLENGMFKLLLALSPSSPVEKAVELISKNFKNVDG